MNSKSKATRVLVSPQTALKRLRFLMLSTIATGLVYA